MLRKKKTLLNIQGFCPLMFYSEVFDREDLFPENIKLTAKSRYFLAMIVAAPVGHIPLPTLDA